MHLKRVFATYKAFPKTSVTADAPPFGQIWFRFVIRVRRTGVLTDRATTKHLPFSPVVHELDIKITLNVFKFAKCIFTHMRLKEQAPYLTTKMEKLFRIS